MLAAVDVRGMDILLRIELDCRDHSPKSARRTFLRPQPLPSSSARQQHATAAVASTAWLLLVSTRSNSRDHACCAHHASAIPLAKGSVHRMIAVKLSPIACCTSLNTSKHRSCSSTNIVSERSPLFDLRWSWPTCACDVTRLSWINKYLRIDVFACTANEGTDVSSQTRTCVICRMVTNVCVSTTETARTQGCIFDHSQQWEDNLNLSIQTVLWPPVKKRAVLTQGSKIAVAPTSHRQNLCATDLDL